MADKLPPLNKFLITALFGGSDFGLDNDNPSGDQEDYPTVAEKAFQAAALRKARGTTSSHDSSWDEPIGTTPAAPLSKDFLKHSDARFAKVAARIRQVFGPDHLEEAEEAIAEADKIRKAARAEAIASVK